MEKELVKRFLSIFFLIYTVLTLVSIGTIDSHAQSGNSFWIEYIDVGQGDAALIQCDGHYMLIDGGPSTASSTIYTILKNKKITKLDYMIASHPDEDHIAGLSGALNYATVTTCYSPVAEYDSKPFSNLVKYLGKQNIKITVPKSGTEFSLGSAKVKILGPITLTTDTNNMSIVAMVTYGKNKFLFTGDAETAEEADLIKNKVDLSCDVLKVSHHGSADATSEQFLKKATPKHAIISVGTDNSYGHPAMSALERLGNANVSIYRTDLQGEIICSSDGSKITFTTEKKVTELELWRDGSTSSSNGSGTDRSKTPDSQTAVTNSYVLNTNTHKFHYPTCSSVSKMKAKNRKDVTATRDEIIAQGYEPCGNCHP